MTDLFTLQAKGISATIDASIGHLIDLVIQSPEKEIRPLARVPWASNPPDCPAIDDAPHLARMGGDFFCAPFGASDVEPAPPHGHPANSHWTLSQHEEFAGGARAVWKLDKQVLDATLTKEWRLYDEDPYLYQAHTFEGGDGDISFAHHVLVNVCGGAKLRMSPRGEARTPNIDTSASDDFSSAILAYPETASDLSRFPRKSGGTVNLLQYPIASDHDDFVMVIDKPASGNSQGLAWSIIERTAFDDSIVLFKPSNLLPQTMLWISNGGRQAAPWLGRHKEVLGVEDACAFSLFGHQASIGNAIGTAPTSVGLRQFGGKLRIPYAIGAFATTPELHSTIESSQVGKAELSNVRLLPRSDWFNPRVG